MAGGTYANTHTVQIPRNSKFRFHVPVDPERLRYCSKIFVTLIKYGNVVLNIVILAVRYLTAWRQNAVFRLFPPPKKIILHRLYDEFLVVNCQTQVRNNAIIILWPGRNRIKNYDLSEKTQRRLSPRIYVDLRNDLRRPKIRKSGLIRKIDTPALIEIVSKTRFQWGSHHRVGWDNRKLSWKLFCSLFLNCSPGQGNKLCPNMKLKGLIVAWFKK